MTAITISMLGRFRLCIDGQAAKCESRKAIELLCCLLLDRGHNQSRELVANRLWSYCTTGQSRAYLRRALWQLHNWLGEIYEYQEMPLVRLDGDMIGIDRNAKLALDVDIVVDIASKYRDQDGIVLNVDQIDEIEEALLVYQGDLLENWYEPWLECRRNRYRNLVFCLMDKTMTFCETNLLIERGIDVGTRLLTFDPAREKTYRSLMLLLYATGNRSDALRQYDSCELAMQSEFGAIPSFEMRSLRDEIIADVGYKNVSLAKRV